MAEKTIAVNSQEHSGNGNAGRETTRTQEQYVRPAVDIYETQEGLVVMADLPGASKDTVELEVENDVLTIKARTQHALPAEPIYREFELMSYYRQFQLSDTVDDEKIAAEFKHGVLTLRIPRAERTKPRQIPVTVAQ
jgi:Molecular chaperone (small heat shock protein)